MNVYSVLAPSAATMISWSQQQRNAVRNNVSDFREACNSTVLHLVDQFFLVLTRLRTGMLELELADRFNMSQTAVS